MGLASLGRRGGDFGDGGDDMRVYNAKTCKHTKTVTLQTIDGILKASLKKEGETPAVTWCSECGSIRAGHEKWVKPEAMKFEGE
jgi:hypothetical protein